MLSFPNNQKGIFLKKKKKKSEQGNDIILQPIWKNNKAPINYY